MKSFILFLSLLLSFSAVTLAAPYNNPIFGTPVPSVTEETNHNICTAVVLNSIQAKRNKNNGLPVSESIAQLDAVIAMAAEKYSSESNEASIMTDALSYMMIKNVYETELIAKTDDELIDLGLIIYDNCFSSLMEHTSWGGE